MHKNAQRSNIDLSRPSLEDDRPNLEADRPNLEDNIPKLDPNLRQPLSSSVQQKFNGQSKTDPEFSRHNLNDIVDDGDMSIGPINILHNQSNYTDQTASANPIMEMQKVILDFANKVSQEGIADSNFSPDSDKDGRYLGGTDAFGQFLANTYMQGTAGKQLVNTDLSMPTRMDTATNNFSLKNIISTMKRVGKPGSENSADGNWGARTNNALKQIVAFGTAMFSLLSDMGLKVNYNRDDLNKIAQNIPQNPYAVSPVQKNKMASEITPLIKTLSNFYETFKKFVLDHPEYKQQIDQNKPFYTLKSNIEPLSAEEQKTYDKNKTADLTGIQINGVPVTLMNLTDMDSFKRFLNSAKIDASDPKAVKKSLDDILSELGVQGAGF